MYESRICLPDTNDVPVKWSTESSRVLKELERAYVLYSTADGERRGGEQHVLVLHKAGVHSIDGKKPANGRKIPCFAEGNNRFACPDMATANTAHVDTIRPAQRASSGLLMSNEIGNKSVNLEVMEVALCRARLVCEVNTQAGPRRSGYSVLNNRWESRNPGLQQLILFSFLVIFGFGLCY